jgi:hypothetical protein
MLINPRTTMHSVKAPEIPARLQPKSCVSGEIKTPNVRFAPQATLMIQKVAATIIYP